MKNVAVNSLKYTGIVTLSQYIGNKKIKVDEIHNAGGSTLFDFFAYCLLGDFDIAAHSRPKRIMLLSRPEGTSEYVSASGFLDVYSKPEKLFKSNMCTVRYSFILSRDFLQSSDSSFTHIGLYGSNALASDVANFAAVCKINKDRWNNMSESSLLVVDWELNISNASS